MNQKSKEQQLAELSYLWTSGEWTLHCSYHSRARVIFIFPEGRPSPQDLLAGSDFGAAGGVEGLTVALRSCFAG